MNRSRVTGDLTASGLLYADIANDRVGIGSTIPGNKLSLPDSAKIGLGNAEDLTLEHNGSGSIIKNTTGNLFVYGTNAKIGLKIEPNAKVRLYYNGSAKFETSNTGATVTGGLNLSGELLNNDHIQIQADSKHLIIGAGDDLRAYHNGTNSIVNNNTGTLFVQSDNISFKDKDDGDFYAKFIHDGAVELYHDNAKKLETISTGIKVLGSEGGNAEIEIFGDEGDDNNDKWKLMTNANANFYLQNYGAGSWQNSILARPTGATELYNTGNLKLATTTTGVTVTGTLTATSFVGGLPITNGADNRVITASSASAIQGESGLTFDGTNLDIDSDSGHLRIGDDQDLDLYHNGSNGYLKNSTGQQLYRSGTHTFENAAGSTEYLRITSTGLMGLGTGSPSDVLEISHDSDPAIRLHYGSNSGYSVISIDNANNLTLDVDVPSAGSNSFFNVKIDGSEKFRIASDGKVGINESTPLARLHVKNGESSASGYAHDTIVVEDSDHAYLTFLTGTSGGAGINFGDSGSAQRGVIEYAHSSDYMRFITAQGERLRIDSSGNVTVKTNDVALSGSGTLRINSGSTSGALNLDGGATNHGGEINLLGGSNGGRIIFRTGQGSGQQTEKMRLNENGRVNIGQASDTDHTLCVAGTDNTTSLTGGHTQGIQLQNKSTTDGTYSQIEWRTSSGGRYARIAGIQDDANGNGGQLVFLTETSGGTTTEALRIASDGKIGIANDAPLYAMHFKNAMASSPSWIHMEVTGSNAVGGGGGIAFDTSASNSESSNTLYLATIKGIRNSLDDGSNDLVFSTSRNGVNSNLPSERLRINSDGRVLIGHSSARIISTTINPFFQLEGTTYNAALSVVRNSANPHAPYIILGKSRSASVGGYTILQDNDVLGAIRFAGADGTDMVQYGGEIQVQVDGTPGADSMPGEMVFKTNTGSGNPTEKLRITKQGIISINDSTPESFATLQIKNHTTSNLAAILLHGADMAQIIMRDDTGGTNTKCTTIRNDQGALIFGTHNDAYSGFSDKLTIASDGKSTFTNKVQVTSLGVGTVPDDHMGLHILQANPRILLKSSGTNAAKIFFGDSSSTDPGVIEYSHSANTMYFGTNNNGNRLAIDSTGKVKIGGGTASLALLHIGPADYSLNLQNNSSNESKILFTKNGTPNDARAWIKGNGELNGYIKFGAGDGDRVTIDSNGTLNIGVTSPTFSSPTPSLNIEKASTGSGPVISLYNSQSANAASTCDILVRQNYRDSNRIIFGRENANNWQASAGSVASFTAFHTNNGSGISEKMRITSGGQVLIGLNSNHANASIDDLQVGNPNSSTQRGITIGSTDECAIAFSDAGDARAGSITYNHGSNAMIFKTSGQNERMRIDGSGNIMCKATNIYWGDDPAGSGGGIDAGRLTVSGSATIYGFTCQHSTQILMTNEQGGTQQAMTLADTSNGTNTKVLWGVSVKDSANSPTTGSSGWNQKIRVEGNGDLVHAGSHSASGSDDRLKKNKVGITSALTKVCGMEGFTFEWNDVAEKIGMGDGDKHFGLSAQTVKPLAPEVVVINDSLVNPDDGTNDYMTIRYEKLVPLLVEAIKDLKAEVDALKSS